MSATFTIHGRATAFVFAAALAWLTPSAPAHAVLLDSGGTVDFSEEVNWLDVSNGTTVHVLSGTVVSLGTTVADTSAVHLHGGSIGFSVTLNDQATLYVYGEGLNLEPDNGSYVLTGVLDDGTELWGQLIHVNDDAEVVLVEAVDVVETDDGPVWVDMDVQPTLNLNARGMVPVVVYSGGGFDATSLDPDTLLLGDPALSGAVHPARSSSEDVDGDGESDLVLHFRMPDLVDAGAIDEKTQALLLTGETMDGLEVVGEDAVRIVGPRGRGR